MSAANRSSSDLLAAAESLVGRLTEIVPAGDLEAARRCNAELQDTLAALGPMLAGAAPAERAAAKKRLQAAQAEHGVAMAALEQACAETRVALSAARNRRRGVASYLEQALETPR